MAPMPMDVMEAVLMPGPEPQAQTQVLRAGRCGGQGCDHRSNMSHSWSQSSQEIGQVA